MKTCIQDGCEKPTLARGLCRNHYAVASRQPGFGGFDTVYRKHTLTDVIDAQGVCRLCGPTTVLYRPDNGARYCINARGQTREHNTTHAEITALLAAQGGGCAVCGVLSIPMAVDHDHACCPGRRSCGKCVRGILCKPCNSALGLFRDNPDTLEAAARYIAEHKQRRTSDVRP